MSAYQVHLPVFEGPLDLLLQLVERRQLDVTTVSLALVADQFLEHLRRGDGCTHQGVDPEQLSEFVAVAAKLLLIKSLALLPQPERPPAAEPPRDPTDLTERLRQYEAVRRAAAYLRGREEADLRSYPRLVPAPASAPPAPPVPAGNGQAPRPPCDLLAAMHRLASRRREEPPVEVAREVWTVAQASEHLLGALREAGRASFGRLVEGFDVSRVVAAFLALLELHRQGRVAAEQPAPFAGIQLAGIQVAGAELAGSELAAGAEQPAQRRPEATSAAARPVEPAAPGQVA